MVNHYGGRKIFPHPLSFGFETVGGCGGANIKYIKNMEDELQGNILGTGFSGYGFEISRNPDISLDDYSLKKQMELYQIILDKGLFGIVNHSDKIHLIKTTKLLRV